MILLKQSTAYTFRLGPFVDATDGVTPETSLTLTQSDFRLSKNGAAFAQKNDATSGTHDENGYYTCVLNTTDTGTLGQLTVHVNESGAGPVWMHFQVVPAAVHDALVSGTSTGIRADVQQIASGAVTAAAVATNAIDADAVATDAVTEIVAGVFARAFSSAYGSYTFDEMVKMMSAVLLGKASGMGTTTGTFRNLADNADVIVATQDGDGNRTAVTRTP